MVERLVQSARFYELLGYTLSVLAFAILGAGVIWSLRSHVSEKRRAFFLVTSLTSLTALCGGVLLWLVLSQQLSIHTINGQRRHRMDNRAVGKDSTTDTLTIEVDVDANGTVFFQGQESAIDRLVARLARENPNKRLHVTLRIDAKATLVVVYRVLDQLDKDGVTYSLQVRR